MTRTAGIAERYPTELHDLLIPDPDDAPDLSARLREWRDRSGRLATPLAAFSDRLRAFTWDQMAERFTGLIDAGR